MNKWTQVLLHSARMALAPAGTPRLVSGGVCCSRVQPEPVALFLAVLALLVGATAAGSFAHAGVLIGLSVAAPIGPIGLVCIRRTLAQGQTAGLVTGLGAATAHALLAFVCCSGLAMVSTVLVDQRTALQLVGGILLCGLGMRALRPRGAVAAPRADQHVVGLRLVGLYASTLPLPLLNPMTLLSLAALIAGSGIASSDGSIGMAASLPFGVLAGSSLWWLVLSSTVGVLRGRLAPQHIGWTTRLSGLAMALFGLLTFSRAIVG